LSAQGLLDNEILDVELNENLIVVGSKSGVNWRLKNDGEWKNVNYKPFLADNNFNLDNIVLGDNSFMVRLDLKNDNIVSFLHYDLTRDKDTVFEIEIPNAKSDMQLYGYDGFFRDNTFFFALGDGGVATFEEKTYNILSASEIVNSIANDYGGDDFLALSPDGKILKDAKDSIYHLKLQPNNEAFKFVKDVDNSSILVLTIDTTIIKKNNLYRLNEKSGEKLIFEGDISKAVATPDGFIYILDSDGKLNVLNRNGESSDAAKERNIKLNARFNNVNTSSDYKFLTDISVFGNSSKYSVAFSSNRGVFYSQNEPQNSQNTEPFEHFYKAVPLKIGLKQVYAEPGILSASGGDKFCTFEYSLEKDDRVTIDIFNYNLDFVCRITENEPRDSVGSNERSTVKGIDRWDGTVNNRGGRPVSPGVYYFKITTQKTKLSAFGKVVVARN
jgi:hypothetical protein